jgi:aminoglycoside phosphotransferase (APT) family kinase protein
MHSTGNQIQSGLLSLCERAFPSREKAQILDLARISDGWETDVYSFTMEYGEAAQRKRENLILRIYPGDDALQKAAAEFKAMKRLYEVGFPVPQVLLLELDAALFGKPFVVMEKVSGRSMGDVIVESPPEKQQELLTLFCKMFVDLHALDWRPFVPDPSLYATRDVAAIVDHDLSQWQEYCHHFQRHEFDPVFDWLRERILDVRFGQPSVIHFDYHPWNILLTDDVTAFVIDWTNVRVSDFRLDLAWTLLLMSTYGNPEGRERVLGEYERIAGHSAEQIEFFDVAACLRRLASILISLSEGPDKLGMRPGAEAMMKNVGHIKSVYALLRDRTGITIAEVEELLSTSS